MRTWDEYGQDRQAEVTVAGCSLWSHKAACWASDRLREDEFYDHRYWSIIVAAKSTEAHDLEERITDVAAITGDPRAFLRQLAHNASTLTDENGWFARRIRAAAEARAQRDRLMSELAEQQFPVLLAQVTRNEVEDLLAHAAHAVGAVVGGDTEDGVSQTLRILVVLGQAFGEDYSDDLHERLLRAFMQGMGVDS